MTITTIVLAIKGVFWGRGNSASPPKDKDKGALK